MYDPLKTPEMISEMLRKQDRADILANWVIENTHTCPFDGSIGSCVGFQEPGCAKCLLDHAGLLGKQSVKYMDAIGHDLSGLRPGDHVLYMNGSDFELGRIKRIDFNARVAYVWYSEGETASRTPFDNLIRLTNGYVCGGTSLGGAAARGNDGAP